MILYQRHQHTVSLYSVITKILIIATLRCFICVCHLLQQLVLLHVFLGGGAGALRLLLEGFVGGHE